MISEAIKNTPRAIIPYITAGLPSLDETGEIIKTLSSLGAAAIEIGIPFSDPMADGPVIQRASKVSIDVGFSLDGFFYHLNEWCTSTHTPIIVMSYINPVMRRGIYETMDRLKACGVSGFIVPDLPTDPRDIFDKAGAIGLDLIRLVAPTTGTDRIKQILDQCMGFVYAVSVKGVTGPRGCMPEGLRQQIKHIKSMTNLPVCVGFGVSKKEHVDDILTFADGVIVGSYLVEKIIGSPNPIDVIGAAFLSLIE
jgi:tryptophan synthase alpha chain